MNFLKLKKHPILKLFTITVLSFFVAGILSPLGQAYENVDMDQVLSVTDDESIPESLMGIMLLTTHIVQLDISSEEKAERFAEVLGYDCSEIYVLAILFEELDDYFPPLKVITKILWWLVDICETYLF